jgi:type I restriction enzyme, S subunit
LNKRTYKIGELSTLLKRGITPSYTDEHLVKVVNQKCIRGFQINLDLARYTDPVKKSVSDEKYLENFDVLVNSTGVGTLGRVAQIFEINQPTTADSHVTIIRPSQKIVDPLYFGYYMKSIQKNIEMLGEGSTGQTELSRVLLSDLEIDIIENIEQQRIVSEFLKVIDTKIELNQQVNKTLEEIAKTLFKSWFIDFDPVRAKSEARPTGLSKEISDLFPDSFDDSELGEVPTGWKLLTFGDFVKPNRGKTITKKTTDPGSVPVVAGGLEPAYFHSTANVQGPVATISASGANAGYVNLYHQDIWASDCSYISNDQTSDIFTSYIFLKINQKRIFDSQHGAAQPHIYPDDLKRLQMVSPDKDLFSIYENLVTPFFNKIKLNKDGSDQLISLRDTLLPKLISGELKIPDAENLIEEANV